MTCMDDHKNKSLEELSSIFSRMKPPNQQVPLTPITPVSSGFGAITTSSTANQVGFGGTTLSSGVPIHSAESYGQNSRLGSVASSTAANSGTTSISPAAVAAAAALAYGRQLFGPMTYNSSAITWPKISAENCITWPLSSTGSSCTPEIVNHKNSFGTNIISSQNTSSKPAGTARNSGNSFGINEFSSKMNQIKIVPTNTDATNPKIQLTDELVNLVNPGTTTPSMTNSHGASGQVHESSITNAVLRKLPFKDAKAILRENGVTEDEMIKMSRWEVIDVLQNMLSNEKVIFFIFLYFLCLLF